MPTPDFRVVPHGRYTFIVLALFGLGGCGASVDPSRPIVDAGRVPTDVAFVCPSDPSSLIGMACSDRSQHCGGPCTNPCEFCNVISCDGAHWMGVEVPPEVCDAGEGPDVSTGEGDASAPDDTDIVMAWQGPGGFAGTGPALVVRVDGTVQVWSETSYFAMTGTPAEAPSATFAVGAPAVDALLALWASADRRGLPHGNATTECSPSVYVRPCASCAATTLVYNNEAQIVPELNGVLGWFQTHLPSDVGGTQPQGYCAF